MYTTEYPPSTLIERQDMCAETNLTVNPSLPWTLREVHLPRPIGSCYMLIFIFARLSKSATQVPTSCFIPMFLFELKPCATMPAISDFCSLPRFSFTLVLAQFILTSLPPIPPTLIFLANFLNLSTLHLPFLFIGIPSQFSNRNLVWPYFFSFSSPPHVIIPSLFHLCCIPIEMNLAEIVPPD